MHPQPDSEKNREEAEPLSSAAAPLAGAFTASRTQNLEQHMLASTASYARLLDDCSIAGSAVLELGCGTGALTRLILDKSPAKLVGFEIEPELCGISHPAFVLRNEDLFSADFSFLNTGEWKLICNPPYSALPFVRNLIDHYSINDAVIMTSKKKAALFPDFQIALVLSGADFQPPSSGEHLVLRKGFR